MHKSGFAGAFLRPCCGNADFPISLADFRKWAGWLASEMSAVDLGNGWLALGGCFLPSEVVLYAYIGVWQTAIGICETPTHVRRLERPEIPAYGRSPRRLGDASVSAIHPVMSSIRPDVW